MNDTRPTSDDLGDSLALTPEQRAAIVAHARAVAPNECCGLLAGHAASVARVERVLPLANADESPTTFRADPADLLAAFESLDAAGLDLLGIYHSHPLTAAYPSPTDVTYARGYPGVVHVVVSLRDPDRPDVRAFRIDGARVSELSIAEREPC